MWGGQEGNTDRITRIHPFGASKLKDRHAAGGGEIKSKTKLPMQNFMDILEYSAAITGKLLPENPTNHADSSNLKKSKVFTKPWIFLDILNSA